MNLPSDVNYEGERSRGAGKMCGEIYTQLMDYIDELVHLPEVWRLFCALTPTTTRM